MPLPDIAAEDWQGYSADQFSKQADQRIGALTFSAAADSRINDLGSSIAPPPPSSDSLTNPLGTGNAPVPEPVPPPPDLTAAPALPSPVEQPAPAPAPAVVSPPPDLPPMSATPTLTPPAPAPAPAAPPPPSGGSSFTGPPDLIGQAISAASDAGIDPKLFLSLVQQESSWNPTAKSPVGAGGLTQLMPDTARGLGVTDINDVGQNLMGGAKYLKQQIDRFGGDVVKALAAYNAGPGAVEKYGGVPPYEETQKYVSTILGRVAQESIDTSAQTGGTGTFAPGPTEGLRRVGSGIDNPQSQGDISQFGNPQLTSDEAYSACGPAAAVRFAQKFGRNPTLREATDLAATVGWTSAQGMAGLGSEKALMDKLQVPTKLVQGAQWDVFSAEAQTGNPVTISTAGHYFTADGYNPDTKAFHVGRSGLDLKGGSEWMTAGQMQALMGTVQGGLLADNPSVPTPSTADQQTSPLDWLGRQKDALVSSIADTAGSINDAGQRAQSAVSSAGQGISSMFQQVTGPQPMAASQQPTPSDTLTNPNQVNTYGTPPTVTAPDAPLPAPHDIRNAFEGTWGSVPVVSGVLNLSQNLTNSGLADIAGVSPATHVQRMQDSERADAILAKLNQPRTLSSLVTGANEVSPEDRAWLRTYQIEQGKLVGSMGMQGGEGAALTDAAGNLIKPAVDQAAALAGRTGGGVLGIGRAVGDAAPTVAADVSGVVRPPAAPLEGQAARDAAAAAQSAVHPPEVVAEAQRVLASTAPDDVAAQRWAQSVIDTQAPSTAAGAIAPSTPPISQNLVFNPVDRTLTSATDVGLNRNASHFDIIDAMDPPKAGVPQPLQTDSVRVSLDFENQRVDISPVKDMGLTRERAVMAQAQDAVLRQIGPDAAAWEFTVRGAEPGAARALRVARETRQPAVDAAPAASVTSGGGKPPVEPPSLRTLVDGPPPDPVPAAIPQPLPPTASPALKAVAEDFDKILAERASVAAGDVTTLATPPDVNKVLNALVQTGEQLSDRRGPLKAIETYIENKRGAPLAFDEKVWLRSRVYEGRQDVALAGLERTVSPAMTDLGSKNLPALDAFLEQMDNVDKAAAIGRKVENRINAVPLGDVRGSVTPGRATEVNLTKELTAAQSNLQRQQNALMLAQAKARGLGGTPEAVAQAQRYVNAAQQQVDRLSTRVEGITIESRGEQARIASTEGGIAADRRAFSGGASVQTHADIQAQLVARYGTETATKIQTAAEAIWNNVRESRAKLVDAGVLSPEQGAFFDANFPHYVRTNILDHVSDTAIGNLPTGGRTFGVGSDGVKALTEAGTTKARQSATSTVVDMAFRAEDLAQKNTIMRTVAGWADLPQMGNFVKKLEADAPVPKGYTAMPYMDGANGKQRIAVVDQMVQSLSLGTPNASGVLGVLLNAGRLPLQLGATALRPGFIAFNMVNDALWTLYRFAVDAPNPVEGIKALSDFAVGYRANLGSSLTGQVSAGALGAAVGGSTGETPEEHWRNAALGFAAGFGGAKGLGLKYGERDLALLQRAREAGGSIGMESRYSNPDLIVRQLAGDHVWVRPITTTAGLKQLLKDGLGATADVVGMGWSRPLNEIGSRVENAPRTAAFYRAQRQGLNPTEAAMKKRTVTVDFSAGGLLTKQLNQLVPFINATTQAGVEFTSTVKQRPAQAIAGMAALMAGIVSTEIYNRHVAPEDYKDVSMFTRGSGLVVMSDKAPEGTGKRGLVFIPVRGGIGMMIPLVREVMGRVFGDNPRTWDALAYQTIGALSPLDPSLSGGVQSFAPPVPALAGELMSNYDTFRGQPIVSTSQQGLPTSAQYNAQTSQTARALSGSSIPGVGGKSPMLIDYGIRGFSPGPAEAILGITDALIKATGNALPEAPAKGAPGARDIPIVGGIAGRFLKTSGSEQQNQAYDMADALVAKNRKLVVDAYMATPAYQQATPDRQQQLLRSIETELNTQARDVVGIDSATKDIGLGPKYRGITDPVETARIDEVVRTVDAWRANPTRYPRPSPADLKTGLQYGNPAMLNQAYRVAKKADTGENLDIKAAVKQALAGSNYVPAGR